MQRNSTLRQAFDNILLKNIKPHCKDLVKHITSSLDRKVGLVRENDWNAKLSMRTAVALKAKEGFTFERQPFTAYDKMMLEG